MMINLEKFQIDEFFNFKISRNEGTPSDVITTLFSWFDGGNSAMFKYANGQTVEPTKLLKEISKCMTENNQGSLEEKRLKKAYDYIFDQYDFVKSLSLLNEEIANFKAVIISTGFDIKQFLDRML